MKSRPAARVVFVHPPTPQALGRAIARAIHTARKDGDTSTQLTAAASGPAALIAVAAGQDAHEGQQA